MHVFRIFYCKILQNSTLSVAVSLLPYKFRMAAILLLLILGSYKARRKVVGGCIQKFPDWPPGLRTSNGTDLCH
jgi:hypothetical protein